MLRKPRPARTGRSCRAGAQPCPRVTVRNRSRRHCAAAPRQPNKETRTGRRRDSEAGGRCSGMSFRDRADAGRRLAELLAGYRSKDVVVVGLPRGGVPVAAEVARALNAPLDVLVVRKLGVPWQPE